MFSATIQAAYSIFGRGTHLLVDIDQGRVVPGDAVRVALHGGHWADVVVSEIEIVDLPVQGGGQSRCALLVSDLDPGEIVIGAEVITMAEWDGNID